MAGLTHRGEAFHQFADSKSGIRAVENRNDETDVSSFSLVPLTWSFMGDIKWQYIYILGNKERLFIETACLPGN